MIQNSNNLGLNHGLSEWDYSKVLIKISVRKFIKMTNITHKSTKMCHFLPTLLLLRHWHVTRIHGIRTRS